MKYRAMNPSQKKLTAIFYTLAAAFILPILFFTVLK